MPLNRVWFLPLWVWNRVYKSEFLVWNRVYFLPFPLWNTVGATILLTEARYKRTLSLFPLGSRCTFTQTRRFRLEGQLRLTFSSLEQGIYFHDFVWNNVAKLRLFGLEQGQVLRHSAAHPHPKLRGVPPRGGGGGGSVFKLMEKSVPKWLQFGAVKRESRGSMSLWVISLACLPQFLRGKNSSPGDRPGAPTSTQSVQSWLYDSY